MKTPTKTRKQTASNDANRGLRKAPGPTLTTSTTSPATPRSSIRSNSAPNQNQRKRLSLGSIAYEELHDETTWHLFLGARAKQHVLKTSRYICDTPELQMKTTSFTLATKGFRKHVQCRQGRETKRWEDDTTNQARETKLQGSRSHG